MGGLARIGWCCCVWLQEQAMEIDNGWATHHPFWAADLFGLLISSLFPFWLQGVEGPAEVNGVWQTDVWHPLPICGQKQLLQKQLLDVLHVEDRLALGGHRCIFWCEMRGFASRPSVFFTVAGKSLSSQTLNPFPTTSETLWFAFCCLAILSLLGAPYLICCFCG